MSDQLQDSIYVFICRRDSLFEFLQSFLYQYRIKMSDMSASSENDSFKATHGRQVNGQFYTYKQLEEKSFGQNLKDFLWWAFVTFLVIFCLLCVYEVDYKKGTQQDVINKLGHFSNYTVRDLVNGSIQVTEQFKKIVKHTLDFNSQRGAELKQWVSNKTGDIYTQIKSAINGTIETQESFVDYVLHLPIYLKYKGLEFYRKYLKSYVDIVIGKVRKTQNDSAAVKEEKVSVQVQEKTSVSAPEIVPVVVTQPKDEAEASPQTPSQPDSTKVDEK